MHILLLLAFPAVALGLPQHLLGAPEQVEELNASQQGIVDFAFSQLASGDPACPKKVVSIENFSEQVVAGTLYKFDLVLGNHHNNASCPVVNAEGKSCTMIVWEKSWENYKEVQWEKVTCDHNNLGNKLPTAEIIQEERQEIGFAPAPGSAVKVEELDAEQQGIVDFAFSQLSASASDSACPKKIVSIENFTEQVVAGTNYEFDLVLGSHDDNDEDSCPVVNAEGKSCRMVVYVVPWESIKRVEWDEVTCEHNNQGNRVEADVLPTLELDEEEYPLLGAPGAPIQGDQLDADQQGIVDFAFSQLSASASDSACSKKIVSIENFTEQVVAGTIYKFDLVLGSHDDNAASCPVVNAEGKSCTMVVHEVSWQNTKDVLWERVTCEV